MAKRPAGEWQPSIPFTDNAFRPYAVALGQFALAWNDLHLTLGMLFCTVMGGGFSNPALAIWNELKADRAQRDILMSAAKAFTLNGGSEKLSQEITWICQRADAIEGSRNDALHSPLWGVRTAAGSVDVQPVTGLGHIRAKKLLGKNLLAEFRWGRDSATVLRDYATRLDFEFCRCLPLSDRPPMPIRADTSGKKPPRQAHKAKHPTPPRSSRA